MAKQICNEPDRITEEMLEGMEYAFPGFYRKHSSVNGLLAIHQRKRKVVLVIGGGAGHEPLFSGFVGKGLADAAVCGNLFMSPDPETIYQVTKAVEQGKGVLFIYGSYAGDKWNFDIGEEQLNADGIATRHVFVHDDVASAPLERVEERRGISGDVFVIKIAGAACDAGMKLDEVTRIAEKANNNIRSIGISTIQRKKDVLDWLNLNQDELEVEYGVGLHGERGVFRTDMQSADQLVDKMFNQIMAETSFLYKGDEVCALVNGLGAVSTTELAIVFRRMKNLLEKEGIRIHDADFHNYCTGAFMNGFSISLMKLDEELKKYYDAPCFSPFFYKDPCMNNTQNKSQSSENDLRVISAAGNEILGREDEIRKYKPTRHHGEIERMDVLLVRDMMMHVADNLIETKAHLSMLDGIIGDGDHGITIARGMQKVSHQLLAVTAKDEISRVFEITGRTLLVTMGGVAGVLFGSSFLSAADTLKNKKIIGINDIAIMWRSALDAVKERGGAKIGDKTMVDSFEPAVVALESCRNSNLLEAFEMAEKAAEKGMLDTKKMISKFGRGKFLANQAIGCQDAGATTIYFIFKAMHEYLEIIK